jgi:hypothetical protein
MTSTIKVDNIQKTSDASNIIKKCGSTITVGSCGATVALASGASQTGFGTPSSSVLWCTTAKTSPFTAADKVGYFVNTTGGTITVTLPASPSAGDVVALSDYANKWATNPVTLCRNSSKINSGVNNVNLNTNGSAITLIFVDATIGWKQVDDATLDITGAPNFISATGGTITTSGDFKIHTFNSSSNFVVTQGQTPANNEVSYLVVAGGGGGGSTHGAGGGAGGFREGESSIDSYTQSPLAVAGGLSLTSQTYPITVGAGGVGATPACQEANTAGAPSTFSSITSTGGGKGSTQNYTNPANAGGSGGGGTYTPNPGTTPGGAGNTPPVSPPQGNNGGDGGSYGPGAASTGGGGGATAVGTAGTPSQSGPGGAGAGTLINPASGETGPGPSQYYAGGGGGGATIYGAPSPASGGIGGGGDGQPLTANSGPANIGAANTGGGGGGGSGGTTSAPTNGDGSAGGSGVVIIRYKFQ